MPRFLKFYYFCPENGLEMKFTYFLILLAICAPFTAAAQHHDEGHNGHSHSRNEIGVSGGGLYGTDDKTWGGGLHIHYYRTLGDHSRWAVGAFAEQAWLEGSHFSAGAGIKFEPVDRLHLGVLPGITVAKHKEEHHGHTHHHGNKTRFSLHLELVYDLFHWDKFHLGPAFDYSWSKKDSHMMLGVHAAYCF